MSRFFRISFFEETDEFRNIWTTLRSAEEEPQLKDGCAVLPSSGQAGTAEAAVQIHVCTTKPGSKD